MKQDEIIKMVRIAEDKVIENPNLDWKIEFAKLVADVATAKEREECAKECEHTALRMGSEWMAQHCANAIRQRGEA